MANFNLNQFAMNFIKGMVDLRSGQPTLSVIADATSAGLVPGQAVKIVASTVRGVPKVVECSADTDDVFGFVVYDQKSSAYVAGDRLEIISGRNGVMYMEANAAITQNAEVALLIAGQKVITATSTDRIVGRALDGASAQGKIIRVVVDLPGAIKA